VCIKIYYIDGDKQHDRDTRWLLNDVHTAITVTTSAGADRLFADFMTADGDSADVWWNEQTQLLVLMGASIPGEVRIKNPSSSSLRGDPSPQLQQLRNYAKAYDTNMNIYTNNCRTFTRRMQREVGANCCVWEMGGGGEFLRSGRLREGFDSLVSAVRL
jgi:hypothetical protein